MKYMEVKTKGYKTLKSLQIFAEGDDAGTADDSNSVGPKSNDTNENSSDQQDELTFDDYLSEPGNQAEFDRRVQKEVQTALGNAERKWKAMTDDKLSEAEKLAQMTKEERTEYENQKLKEEIEKFKKQNALSDMSKTARKMLLDEEINIPDELLSKLISDNADETKDNIEAFVKLFKDTVQNAVKEALKGNPPKTGTGGKTKMTKEQILAIKNPAERQRMIAENITLFQ